MNNEYALIYEGKAKKVFSHHDPNKVIIRFKDDATKTEKTVWTLFLVYFGYVIGKAGIALFEYIF